MENWPFPSVSGFAPLTEGPESSSSNGLAPRERPCYEPVLEKQVSGQCHGLPTVSTPVETDWLWVSVVKDQTASPSILESELLSQALDRTRWPRVPANTTPDPFGGAEATRDQTRPESGKEVDHRFLRLALLWGLASRRLGFHHLGIQENAKDFLRRFPDLLQQPRTLLF
jgi:hypothetical protein